MKTSIKLGLILALMAIGLAGCGVRGSLEPPPEDKAAAKVSADDRDPREPNKPFILDGLIR